MKKIISMIMVCVLLVGMLFTLASCAKLSGTYEDESGLVSYTFKGKNFSAEALGVEIEGTYKIKGDEITFTYELMGEEVEETVSFEKDGNTIKIGGVELTKK